jgi:hypothetical protein
VRLEGGRLLPIKRPAALSYLVGLRYALFKHARDGAAIAADLDDQTAAHAAHRSGGMMKELKSLVTAPFCTRL